MCACMYVYVCVCVCASTCALWWWVLVWWWAGVRARYAASTRGTAKRRARHPAHRGAHRPPCCPPPCPPSARQGGAVPDACLPPLPAAGPARSTQLTSPAGRSPRPAARTRPRPPGRRCTLCTAVGSTRRRCVRGAYMGKQMQAGEAGASCRAGAAPARAGTHVAGSSRQSFGWG